MKPHEGGPRPVASRWVVAAEARASSNPEAMERRLIVPAFRPASGLSFGKMPLARGEVSQGRRSRGTSLWLVPEGGAPRSWALGLDFPNI